MKRFLIAILVLSLLLPVATSWSAPKTGAKCSKLGKKEVLKNFEYTCIKKSGKLVWSKGKKISIAMPDTLPTPTPSSQSTATPSSTPTPSATTTASDQPQKVYEKAFLEIERAYKAAPAVKLNLKLMVSSDALKSFELLLPDTLEKSARLWSSVYLPQGDFPVIFGNSKSVSWIQNEMRKYGHELDDFDLKMIRDQGVRAGRGDVRINNQSTITYYAIGDAYENPPSSSRSFIAHEYTHIIQVWLFKSRLEGIPRWAIEGSASFFGDAISSIASGKGLEEYAALRKNSVRREYPQSLALNSLTRDRLYEVITSIESGENQNVCAEPQIVCYTAGAALTEKLIADFGFDKFAKWWELSAKKHWYTAFEEAFGMNLDLWYQESGVPHVQQSAQEAIPEVRIPSPNTYNLKPKRITDPIERWDATGSNAMTVFRKWGTSKLDEKPKTKIEYNFSTNFWKDVEPTFRSRFDSVVAYWDRFLDIQIPIYFMAGTKDDVEWICKLLETKDPQKRRAAGCIENESRALKEIFGVAVARGFDLTNGSANFYIVKYKEAADSLSFKPRIEHEYFHSVQQNLLRNRFRTNIPCWFLEGGSEYFGILTSAHGDAELFLKLRRATILGAPEKRKDGVTAQDLTNWINASSVAWQLAPEAWADNCSPFAQNGLYHDGILATEWLVDRIGVDGVLTLTKDAATTSWAEAFEKKVGMPIKDAHRLIGEYMFKERVIAQYNGWMPFVFCNKPEEPGPIKSPPNCWFN